MEMLEIGKSGISVPYIGMGTWAIGGGEWWGDNDDRVSAETIHRAMELGIVWIDTAPIYGLYHSEKVVGEALKNKRDKVVLSTKCGIEWRHETPIFHKRVDNTDVYRDLSKKSIIEDAEHSLMMLKTDYIDVLYTHWQTTDNNLYPVEETMDALMTLKKQGKIRAIGASNVTPDIVREYCRYGTLDVIQEKYSILTRGIEGELLDTCRENNVSIQIYSPLVQGLLTGKVTMDSTYSDTDVRARNIWFEPSRRKKVLDMLDSFKPLTEKYNCTMSELIIAATGKMIYPVHVLCGARKPEQIEDNAGALNINIEPQDVMTIRQAAESISK